MRFKEQTSKQQSSKAARGNADQSGLSQFVVALSWFDVP